MLLPEAVFVPAARYRKVTPCARVQVSSGPKVVSRVLVKEGDVVEQNQVLLIIEAMKMETAITARMSGTVESVCVKEGDTVKGGQLLITLK